MIPYRKYRPTACDIAGLGLGLPYLDWLVCPCSRNRDSNLLETANWESQLKAIEHCDPSGADRTTYQFGHWGPGWIEILLVRPGSPAAAESERLECRLADYPVLDDLRLSELEWDACLTDLDQTLARVPRQDLPHLRVSSEAVYAWISEHKPGEVEDRTGEGASPSYEAVAEAVFAIRRTRKHRRVER